jgi:hypothetical protein
MRLRPASLGGALPGLVVAAASLAGCGSSSSGKGLAAKTPAEIVAATRLAADSANSVHVSGAIVSAGSPITLDMDLLAGKGGRGHLSESGLNFELIQTGGAIYIKGSPAFYAHVGGAAAARLFRGRWLRVPATRGNFASLASLVDLRQLVDTTLAGHGTLVKGATTTIAGQRALAVTDTSTGGTLHIAANGPTYPIEVTKAGPGGGRIVFDRWNERVSLAAPQNAIDLTRQRLAP